VPITNTVHKVYSSPSAMFRDAKLAGYPTGVEQTPCELTIEQLGPVIDKDPERRDGAVYTRDEARS
jgi:hypothetical protein